MPDQPSPTSTIFEIPIRLSSSHHIAHPGFQSDRRGQLWNSEIDFEKEAFSTANAKVLDLDLVNLTIFKQDANWYSMRIQFAAPLSIEDASSYFQRLAEAFTASLAGQQKDPWYGNLGLELGVAGLRDRTPKSSGSVAVIESFGLQSIDNIAVNRSILEGLKWSSLATIFVEGMRATQPKSKFLFWFVILEELEKDKQFQRLFLPLFTNDEKEILLKANLSPAAKQRLTGLLNNPATTIEGRSTKLLRILNAIGLQRVATLTGDIEITEEICKSLIQQRNTVAHKGAQIDEDQLYTILFPLARGALDFLTKQDQATAG